MANEGQNEFQNCPCISHCFADQLMGDIRSHRILITKPSLAKKLEKMSPICKARLLHCTITAGNELVAQYLITLNCPIECCYRDGQTPLMRAVEHGLKSTVRALLKAGANIDIIDDKGQSAFHMALDCKKDVKIVEAVLLRAKAEAPTTEALIEKLLGAGCCFPYAVLVRDADVLEKFLERGYNVNSRNFREKRTALHFATFVNDFELVNLLIDHGADVNAYDQCALGPLFYASLRLNPTIIKLLIDHSAKPYPLECDMFDQFPLYACLISEEIKYVKTVLECTALILQQQALHENEDVRLFNFQMLDDVYRSFDETPQESHPNCIIEHLAMSYMICAANGDEEKHFQTLLNLRQKHSEYYTECNEIIKIKIFGSTSLFELLDCSKQKMRVRVRGSEAFVAQVEQFCHSKLKESHFYYFDTLLKRIAKASYEIELEDKGIPVICSLFHSNFNELFVFARRVVGYLTEYDLEKLCQV